MDWKRFEKVKNNENVLRKARFLKFSAKFDPFVKEIQVLKPGKLIIKDKAEIPEDFLLGRATINSIGCPLRFPRNRNPQTMRKKE